MRVQDHTCPVAIKNYNIGTRRDEHKSEAVKHESEITTRDERLASKYIELDSAVGEHSVKETISSNEMTGVFMAIGLSRWPPPISGINYLQRFGMHLPLECSRHTQDKTQLFQKHFCAN